MTHYRLQDQKPSAIVTVGGSEKKVYEGNIVYLKKGDNFELRFFNPLPEKIGIEIIFNGQKRNDGFLVLNPGQDVSLDRFLDDKKKMIFDTYMIDSNNPSALEATKMNGIIDINFYKEKIQNYTNIYGSLGTNINYDSNFSTFTSSVNGTFTTSNLGNFENDFTQKSLSETGRVEKGEESNQSLNEIDIQFENYSFHNIQYKLKPESTKTYTTNEIRNYCKGCGYRIRKTTWKFCPKCGQKLI